MNVFKNLKAVLGWVLFIAVLVALAIALNYALFTWLVRNVCICGGV